MTTQVMLVKAHEPVEVEGIIMAALLIADKHEGELAQWLAIFDKACDLLGKRFPVTQEATALPWNGNLHNVRV